MKVKDNKSCESDYDNSRHQSVLMRSCPDENPERLKVLDISNFFTLLTVENYINLEENDIKVHVPQN